MSLLLLSSNNAVAAAVADKDSVLTLSSNISAANGSQNNTFIDSSVNNATVTRGGTPTQGSFSPYGDRWSNYFNGASGLSIADSLAFYFGSGDVTVEAWVYLVSLNGVQVLWGQSPGSDTNMRVSLRSGICNCYSNFSDATEISSGYTMPTNKWVHVAYVKSGTAYTLFANGVIILTFVGAGALPDLAHPWEVGYEENVLFTTGYLCDHRVVKGTALYTANFTPPTTPLTAITGTVLLTCQSNRLKDNSINNFAITAVSTPSVTKFSPYVSEEYKASTHGGSLQFNGSTDYLSTPESANTQFAGDFTIEISCYYTGTTLAALLGNYTTNAVTDWYIDITATTNTLRVYTNGATLKFSTVITPNCWVHVALVRSGSVITGYLNGISFGNTTQTGAFGSAAKTIYIGSQAGAELFPGYLSNARIVNGTALYTANFTPPTVPLVAITNTALLLSGTNAGIIDSTANTDLVTIGSAQVDTAIKPHGIGSMKFNGTTDYLTTPANPNYIFGTGDFTIECWMYPNGTQVSSACLVNINAATSPYIQFGYKGTGGINIAIGTAWVGTNTTVPAPLTWSHVAAVRRGTALTIYLNGIDTTTTTNSTAITGGILQIGAANGGSLFKGNISDLKISKTAKYTSNFTPPTNSF